MPQDPDFLRAAIVGYQEKLKQADARIADLRQRLDGGAPTPAAAPPFRKKRRLSRKARANIVAAQTKRWAAFRKAKAGASVLAAQKRQ